MLLAAVCRVAEGIRHCDEDDDDDDDMCMKVRSAMTWWSCVSWVKTSPRTTCVKCFRTLWTSSCRETELRRWTRRSLVHEGISELFCLRRVVLVRWRWRFHWSFARLIMPVVITTFITLSSNNKSWMKTSANKAIPEFAGLSALSCHCLFMPCACTFSPF